MSKLPTLTVKTYMDMLTYKRPAWSVGEFDYVEKFIKPYAPNFDNFGNLYIKIGDNPKILFSSHTDTMHNESGRQILTIDRNIVKAIDSNCLGADDATGNFVMMNMIRAGIDGLYVFHRAEELGGQGSSWIVNKNKKFLDGIEQAVAFDRRGKMDIITHQAGSRCCSDKYADALSAQLNNVDDGMSACYFTPDNTGIFTDTAMYIDIIPECTNISVGYENEHTSSESQDIAFMQKLVTKVLCVDWKSLPIDTSEKGYIDDYSYNTWYDDYKFDDIEDEYISYIENNPYDIFELIARLEGGQHLLEELIDEDYYRKHLKSKII